MPFKSQAQQRYMFATQPKTAEKLAHQTPNIKKLPQHVRREDSPMQAPMQQNPMQQAPQPEPLQIELPDQDMGVVDQYAHPGCDDAVGDIFVVLKPTHASTAQDIMHKTHAFGVHQFDPHTVHGVYGDEGEANLVAEGAIKDLHKHLTKVEKKKDTILEKIGKKIRDAELAKVPFMLIVGEKEFESNQVSVRRRGHGDHGSVTQEAFVAMVQEAIATELS